VLLARDARQALQLFDSRKDEISAVMSDYSMPEMNGVGIGSGAETPRSKPSGDPHLRVPASNWPRITESTHPYPKVLRSKTILNQIKALVSPNGTGQVATSKAAAAAAT